MKLNPKLVTQLRKQRAWSQDELATAAGLNLRTVQRIESSGTASLQSAKSIASALNADLADVGYSPEGESGLEHSGTSTEMVNFSSPCKYQGPGPMTAKQAVGLTGSVIVVVGCVLPVADIPWAGELSYAFPGGRIGDGVLVGGFAFLGMIGALRGWSLLLLVSSLMAALIFGNTVAGLYGAWGQALGSARSSLL